MTASKGRWWVSWCGQNGTFELHSPWWISGTRIVSGDDPEKTEDIFCAAILADSAAEARMAIVRAHDDYGAGFSEWRFVKPRADDWQPFCDRFPRVDWMQWPKEYAAS